MIRDSRECRRLSLVSLVSQTELSLSSSHLTADSHVSAHKKTLSKVPYLTVSILSYFDMLAANAFIGGRRRRDESTDTASPCAESRIM